MVDHYGKPEISWEEDFSPAEEEKVSAQIFSRLVALLPPLTDDLQRLYMVIPTPSPYPFVLHNMMSELVDEDCSKPLLRTVKLQSGGVGFLIQDDGKFQRFIPFAFKLGPPELTFIASNCDFNFSSTQIGISEHFTKIIRSRTRSASAAGMHFDSGDLVEVF